VLSAIIWGLVQGLTEFLPISSDAHLVLMPELLGWHYQGLAFDVALHVGTLAAVVIYFRHELVSMAREWTRSLVGRGMTPDARLAWAVLLGTIPVGLAGLLLKDLVEHQLRTPVVIGFASVGFGLLLWWADATGKRVRDEHGLTWKDVLIIGCAQAVALIPGTSRSGITMTAGRMLGLKRAAAARYSFLLSIPVIVLAGSLEIIDLVRQRVPPQWGEFLLGAVLSAITAYLCIHFFLRYIQHASMLVFVVYRVLLGAFLLYWFL
jgi:undecaprenyl-diphosphatase